MSTGGIPQYALKIERVSGWPEHIALAIQQLAVRIQVFPRKSGRLGDFDFHWIQGQRRISEEVLIAQVVRRLLSIGEAPTLPVIRACLLCHAWDHYVEDVPPPPPELLQTDITYRRPQGRPKKDEPVRYIIDYSGPEPLTPTQARIRAYDRERKRRKRIATIESRMLAELDARAAEAVPEAAADSD